MRTTSLLACVLLWTCGCGVSKPGKAESTIANEVKHKMTVGGKGIPNPLPATDENVAEGREHFGHHCGICHGLDGQSTGVPFAAHMSPPVPDLTSKDVQEYADGQLKWIMDNGINPSGMPAWKEGLTDEEKWKIVLYLRRLPPKGSLGIPDVYKEEQEQHEHTHGQHSHGDAHSQEHPR